MSVNSLLRLSLLVVIVFGASPAMLAEDAPVTFKDRIDVEVLNLEVVVTDKDGQRVAGLEKGDFRLLVDGEEVPVEFFSEIRDREVQPSASLAPGLEAGETAGTSFLLFIDEVFTIKADKTRVLRALSERVENLRPEDRVAIVAWDGSDLAILSDWTSSKSEIAAAIETAMKRPSYGLQRQAEQRQYNVSLQGADLAAVAYRRERDPFSLGTQERMYANLLVSQLNGCISAATGAMRGLEVPAGRKILMLANGGWPMEVADYVGRSMTGGIQEYSIPSGAELYGPVSDVANLLGYTIYGVDMPGLQSGSATSAARSGPAPAGLSSLEFYLEGEIHETLSFVSYQTGGFALLNGQRISALDEIRSDVSNFYWLGVTPRLAQDDERYDIEVEVNDPNLRVRARQSYVDISPRTQVALAIRSAILFGPAVSSEELRVSTGPSEKAGRGRVQVPVSVTVPTSALQFRQVDGGFRSEIVVIVVALDESGGQSEITPVPLVFNSPRRPKGQEVVTYDTVVKMLRKTKRLAVAAYDTYGSKTYTRILEL